MPQALGQLLLQHRHPTLNRKFRLLTQTQGWEQCGRGSMPGAAPLPPQWLMRGVQARGSSGRAHTSCVGPRSVRKAGRLAQVLAHLLCLEQQLQGKPKAWPGTQLDVGQSVGAMAAPGGGRPKSPSPSVLLPLRTLSAAQLLLQPLGRQRQLRGLPVELGPQACMGMGAAPQAAPCPLACLLPCPALAACMAGRPRAIRGNLDPLAQLTQALGANTCHQQLLEHRVPSLLLQQVPQQQQQLPPTSPLSSNSMVQLLVQAGRKHAHIAARACAGGWGPA